MHFQVIRDDYFDKIVSELEIFVPEFTTVFEKEDGMYPILGDFGRFLCDNINNSDIVKKSFSFINHALTQGGSDTEDIIVIQIFEKIYEKKDLIEIAKSFLSDKSLSIFNRFNIKKE